jgi:uncharacterized RDD family membrane protein YckC
MYYIGLMNPLSSLSRSFSGKRLVVVLSLFTTICCCLSFLLTPVFRRAIPGGVADSIGYVLLTFSFSPGMYPVIRFISLFLCLLLLIGAVQMVKGGGNGQLVSFVAAVLLFDHLVGLLSLVSGDLTNMLQFSPRYWIKYLIGAAWIRYAGGFVWCAIAVLLLKETQRHRGLAIREVLSESGDLAGEYVHGARGVRFLNLLIDMVVCCTYFLLAGRIWSMLLFQRATELLGERNAVILYFVLFRVSYYLFFETVYQATPGKFLTGTRVADFYGQKIVFSQALSRTFSRMVPFEPFSFLGKGDGWHDRWSQTYVLKEGKG